ncbi:MAG: PAS domain S-box protein [Gemmatimonadaceae bacterium]|nr:PAS domain S-box protein [Chitinophagaceae bacterium]
MYFAQTDANGTILCANDFLGELLESDTETLRGTSISLHFPELENSRKLQDLSLHTFEAETETLDSAHFGRQIKWKVTRIQMKDAGPVTLNWNGTEVEGVIKANVASNERQRYLAGLMESVSDIITSQDLDMNVVSWNHAAEHIYGYTAAEMIGRKIHHYLKFIYHNSNRQAWMEAIFTKGYWKGEVSVVNKRGELVTLISTTTQVKDENGQTTGFVTIAKDISENERNTQQLRESEQRFRMMADTAPVMIWISDKDDKTTYVNKYWADFTGMKEVETMDDAWFKVVHPEDMSIAVTEYRSAFDVRKPIRMIYRLKHHSDGYHWVMDHAVPRFLTDGTFLGYIGSIADINESKIAEEQRQLAEEALQKSELFYKTLISDSMDGILLTDAGANITYAAASISNILGHKPESLIGHNAISFVHPEDQPFVLTAFTDEVEKKPKHPMVVARLRKDDNSWIWCSLRGHNLMENDHINGLVIYVSDDTSRQKMENALRENEQRFRNLTENAPTVIQRLDKNFRYTFCNKTFTRLFGPPAEITLGKTPEEMGFTGPPLQQFMKAAKKTFRFKTIQTLAMDIQRKSGAQIKVLVTIAPELDGNGEVESILAITSDLTALKEAEQLLVTKEEELFQSKERFELATKAASDTIWELDISTGYTFITPEFAERFGYGEDDISGQNAKWFIERLHPEDRLSVVSKLTSAFSKKAKLWSDEFRLRCKDGAYKYIHNQAYIFYDHEGNPYRSIGAIQDITQRKLSESQLIQKDILLAASALAANELLTESVFDTGISKSLQIIGQAVKVDRAYIFQHHYRESEAKHFYRQVQEWNSGAYSAQIDNPELQYFAEIDYPEIFGNIREGQPSQISLKNAKRKELLKHMLEQDIKTLNIVPIFVQNNFWGFVGFDQCSYERVWTGIETDILKAFASNLSGALERKEAERKQLESELKYRSLFQSSLDIIHVLDKDLKIQYITPSVTTILGYSEDDLTHKTAIDLIHPADAADALKVFNELLSNPSQHVMADMRVKNKQGEWIWVEAKGINRLQDPVIRGLIVNFRDITDRKQSEQKLQGYSEHITNILNSITDGFIALDYNSHVLWWNPIAERLTGVKDLDVLGKNIWKALPLLKRTVAFSEYQKTIREKSVTNIELYIEKLGVYYDINAYPSQQGLFVYFKDITARKKQEMLLELEREVLGLNVNAAISLQETAEYFLEGMERINPGMMCSVLLLDDSRFRVKHLAAKSLPEKFIQRVNGLEIGPRAGSCGTAMFLQKSVIVTDILTDPLWDDYRPLATQYGLQACWSFPIITSSNRVLGSFACYYKTLQAPTPGQIEILERAASLIGIIIENKNAEKRINLSNERYLLATKATNDAIWDFDVKNNVLYWGESFYTLFDYPNDTDIHRHGFWESKLHPDDRERVVRKFDDAIKEHQKEIIYAEYRFQRGDGKYAFIIDRSFVVYDANGEPTRFVGSMQDITERKKLERKVLKQEIDKQKIIAQAVVDAQEKERAEIGKELHDNVNQILSTAKLYLELAKTDAKQRNELIKRSADSIFNAINEIRNISRALVPPSVKDLGLIDSINDLVEPLRMTVKTLKVRFHTSGELESVISDKQKLMLFRIIQEQVNNVLKHAEATELLINLVMDEKHIQLSITDNGKGFELAKVQFKKGVGLSNIESRANLFNGRVTITASPGKGCKLLVQVPIHHK